MKYSMQKRIENIIKWGVKEFKPTSYNHNHEQKQLRVNLQDFLSKH